MSQRKSSLAAELRPEWLRDIDARLGSVQTAVSGGSGGGLGPHALSDTSIHTGTLSPGQAPWALTNSVAVIAGNGLTGGGTLTTDMTLNVGGGTLISIGADAVNLANGTAQYQVPVTGASPFTPAWTGLSDFAGNGLSFTAGVFAVGQGAGLTVDATTVALTLPGGLNATTTNNAGGNHTHAIATGAASTLTVATTNTTGTGTNLARADHTHAITSSSNPGAVASILASNSDGYLTLVRLVATERLRSPLLDTASGPLTLQPANNVVNLPAAVAIQTDNYASQLTGWRATYLGEADFRYLFVDELHAKAFIADLEQALAGGQIISKSVAMVAEAFTVPAAGAAATLRVRDLPSAPDMAVFQGGDIVRLRTFSRVNGSLSIEDAWGVVTNYIDQTDGTQTWTFTRSSAPNSGAMLAGTVIQPDSLVLDYGVAGNGFYEVNAIDGQYGQNSPYARIATWTGHPATGTALRAQFGNLRGVYGYPPDTSVFGVAMGDSTGANVTVDATNGVRLRNGTTDKIVLAPDGSSYFAGVMTIGTSGEIRQGTGTIGSNFTGLRIWRDGSIGRIAGYNNNVLQWYGGTDGYLYGGAGTAAINRYGYLISDVDISGGATWPFSYGGLHSVANVSTPTTNYRGSLMFGTPPGVYANAPRSWFVHYPGTLPASIPVGGGASLPLALMISDDSGNGPWAVWHAGNDGAASGLDADLLDGYHASAFALLSGAIFNGNVSPNTGGTRDLGTSGAPWRRIYVDEVIASTITGSTGLVGSVWQNDPSDMYIRSNSSSARTLYIANPGTGLMHLDVEGNITLGGTVDGVDVSAHAADVNAHHARSHAITSTSDHTASGLTAGQVLRATGSTTFAWQQLAHGDLSGIGTNTHAQIDTHIGTTDIHVAHSSVSITAGDGLTGGGTIAATRTLTLGTPGSSTATSTNAVTSTSHTHAIDSTIARSAITVSAGNGLTGGGDLTANRTLTLGTPSGLDASTTNAVTSTSHTHAISTAAAVGLSATTTNAAGTSASLARADHTHAIATGAASTLTVASTNTTGSSSNLARADHTHAITSSSNPGAAASLLATDASGYLRLARIGLGMSPTRPLDVTGDAGITGQVSAGSGSITGALTVGGDLTVGSTVLQVSASGTRVGINRAADQQFDLDVAGAIRGQYLIGKHAIQLASAVGVWHFDGPAPYALDFTGSNASHMGVGGTETGGVIYRPGKFGKAVQVTEAKTNLIANPSFEASTTGWSTYEFQTPTATWNGRTSADAAYGEYSYKITKTAGTTTDRVGLRYNFAVTNGTTYTISVHVKVPEGMGNVTLFADTGLPATSTTVAATGDWQRLTITATATSTTTARLIVWAVGAPAHTMYIDAAQVEAKAYATTYTDTSRAACWIAYSTAGMSPERGTIMCWAYPEGLDGSANQFVIGSVSGGNRFGIRINSDNQYLIYIGDVTSTDAVATAEAGAWQHLTLTWDNGTYRFFKNGVQTRTGSYTPMAALAATFYVGNLTGADTYKFNGAVDELVILDYAADPKLIRAIYESDAPVFVESSVFHWRSPSRVPIWVDEFGLWARGVSGNEILGLYGGDPRNPTGNVTRSWGGITMEENDIVIGRAAQEVVHWDDSAGTLQIGRPSASNLLLSGGAAQMRDSATIWGSWSNSGVVIGRVENSTSRVEITSAGAINMINRNGSGVDATAISLAADGSASFSGAITASSGSITGTLTMGASGQITLGSTSGNHISIDAASINLVSATDAGINGFSFRSAVGSANETGYLKQRISTSGSKSAQVIFYGAKFWIDAAATLSAQSATPASPASSAEGNMYVKSNKLIIQYNDGGTVRYKYLDLTGTGVTWVHTTTAP